MKKYLKIIALVYVAGLGLSAVAGVGIGIYMYATGHPMVEVVQKVMDEQFQEQQPED